MVYLNQAATTWPKPEIVEEAVKQAIALPPFSQNRSGAVGKDSVMESCRKKLANLFHIEDEKRIYFTSGATDSFNRIVRGLELENRKVLVTANEHNAVLRPLYNIYHNLTVDVADCDCNGQLLYEQLEEKMTEDVCAVFVNHCSNVTGVEVDLERIARIVHTKDAILVADVSQSAGHLSVDVEKQGIDILVFTGHKGLFGIQGTGGYYVRPQIALRSSVYGGTGYDSKRLLMEADNREYEVGTQNLPGIAALAAGADYILQVGTEAVLQKEQTLISALRHGLAGMNKVTVYGTEDAKGSVVSFNIQGLSPSDVAYILANNYNIIVRSGYHCAALIHKALGCDWGGTVRASVSCLNTMEEIDMFLKAIRELEQSI